MKFRQAGFTLVELMITVAIIGIITAVALPKYQGYIVQSADKACLAEVKVYIVTAIAALDNGDAPVAASPVACQTIDTAVDLVSAVTATPKEPGTGSIACTLNNGSRCVLTPGT